MEPEGSAGPPDQGSSRGPREDPVPGFARGLALDHVAIAVRSFDDGIALLERLSGAKATRPEAVASQGVEVCFVGSVELIRPLAADNGVARFIDRRGPGLHHVAYRVPDIAGAMAELSAQGYVFTTEAPMAGARGHRIAFMHPRSTGGVLVELVEKQ